MHSPLSQNMLSPSTLSHSTLTNSQPNPLTELPAHIVRHRYYTFTQAATLFAMLSGCGGDYSSDIYAHPIQDDGTSSTSPVNGSRIASVTLVPNKYRVRGWACVNLGVIGSAGLRIDGIQVASLLPKPCDTPRNWAEWYGYLDESAGISAAIPTSDGSSYSGHVEAVVLP